LAGTNRANFSFFCLDFSEASSQRRSRSQSIQVMLNCCEQRFSKTGVARNRNDAAITSHAVKIFRSACCDEKLETGEVMEKEMILLVEDEQLLLELLKLVLEENGYRVVTAANGEEAVKIFRQKKNKVGIVLTDMGLPKLGGWEMFEKLRAIDPNVKVILASGFVNAEMKSEAMKKGAKDFIQKPYIPATILKRIREVLDSG
jgi:CheY-like chemotaxis protein